MATKLEEQVEELRDLVKKQAALLEQHGIRPRPESVPPTERPDYVAHGSARHAALLGLVEVAEDDPRVTIATYTSPTSKKTFALEDELGALQFYPGVEPEKAVKLVLQQKVNELENKPTVPDDALPMFQPVAIYPT